MKNYYNKKIDRITNEFQTDLSKGLTTKESYRLLKNFGKNIINLSKSETLLSLFFEQFKNPIVIMLLGTVVIAGITGEIFEAVLILGIVIFMALVGTYLEGKAGNAVRKLKDLTVLYTSVVRGGKLKKIPASKIVPGDLLLLHEGDRIPADCRVVESNDASIDESILTGESIPVLKHAKVIREKVGLADQSNMLFNGTFVLQGNVKALVVRTGLRTELGKIATKLAEIDSKETPIQKQLNSLSKILLWGTLVICIVISIFTVIRGQSVIDALVQALSLAIAFIPEGLSAVMTITLAMGVKEMVKKKVIIKRLLAAEGLGSVSILATDKTGTITEGKMTVEKVWVVNREVNIENFKPSHPIEKKIVEIVRFCNNSKGATEIALVVFLEKLGLDFEIEERIVEHRFSSALKRMMVIRKGEEGNTGYSKGAPDVLIPLCSRYLDSKTDKTVRFSELKKEKMQEKVNDFAREGFRVLCLSYKPFDKTSRLGERESDESALVFVGLLCLMDPVRKEVKGTVERLIRAGVRPIMITGDHKEIAKTIAFNSGILNTKSKNTKVITGEDLEEYFSGKGDLSTEDVLSCSVFARVDPDHKNKLVDLFHDEGFIAAMAGDGVNDAVAISKADIGIAVVNGADIVKEAADVIVTGTYDALGNAVEVGRIIIQRTRLYLHYILSGNVCEIGVFILALLFNKPLPLTAISLLIINLLTDAAPAMAMAFEKGDENLMKQKPRPTSEGIINKQIWISIGIQGVLTSIFLFIVFILTLDRGIVFAQTVTFTAYIFQKLLRAFTARSFTKSVFKYGFLTNKYTVISVSFAVIVWFVVVFIAPGIFKMEAIELQILIRLFLIALIFPVVEEVLKYFRRIKLDNIS